MHPAPTPLAGRKGEKGAAPAAWMASRTFSRALSPSKRAEVWKERARPRRARRVELSRVTSSSLGETRPVVGRVTPERMLTSEDLPAPLSVGPRTRCGWTTHIPPPVMS